MYVSDVGISCGVHQLCEIGEKLPRVSWERRIKHAYTKFSYYQVACTILFSDAVCLGNGRSLAKALKRHGRLTKSPIVRNTNSDNDIETWIFLPNEEFRDSIENYRKKHR